MRIDMIDNLVAVIIEGGNVVEVMEELSYLTSEEEDYMVEKVFADSREAGVDAEDMIRFIVDNI